MTRAAVQWLLITLQHKGDTMTIERTFQGAYKISAIVNGYLVTKQYMGYTKREAVEAFKALSR